jgi:hypothetical protein
MSFVQYKKLSSKTVISNTNPGLHHLRRPNTSVPDPGSGAFWPLDPDPGWDKIQIKDPE